MDNKHTGQVYRQNAPYAGRYPLRLMSRRDHFLKSAKAFGVDRAPVREVLAREGVAFEDRDDLDSTEFPLDAVALLRGGLPDIPSSPSATPSASPATARSSARAAPRQNHPLDLRFRARLVVGRISRV